MAATDSPELQDLDFDGFSETTAEGIAVAGVAAEGHNTQSQEAEHSSIFSIVADDLGWGDEEVITYATDDQEDWHDGEGFLP